MTASVLSEQVSKSRGCVRPLRVRAKLVDAAPDPGGAANHRYVRLRGKMEVFTWRVVAAAVGWLVRGDLTPVTLATIADARRR